MDAARGRIAARELALSLRHVCRLLSAESNRNHEPSIADRDYIQDVVDAPVHRNGVKVGVDSRLDKMNNNGIR